MMRELYSRFLRLPFLILSPLLPASNWCRSNANAISKANPAKEKGRDRKIRARNWQNGRQMGGALQGCDLAEHEITSISHQKKRVEILMLVPDDRQDFLFSFSFIFIFDSPNLRSRLKIKHIVIILNH